MATPYLFTIRMATNRAMRFILMLVEMQKSGHDLTEELMLMLSDYVQLVLDIQVQQLLAFETKSLDLF